MPLELGAETSKARPRRERDGFFSYIKGRGIDIGCGIDPLTPDCDRWDDDLPGCGDATFMHNVSDASYDWVYSSHCLEHLLHPEIALHNWWRILKPGGTLILYVPHRNLYEKKELLPSRWNPDHKFFILPFDDEAPNTFSLEGMIRRNCEGHSLIRLKDCDEGWIPLGPETHSHGEYSIEAIIRKLV